MKKYLGLMIAVCVAGLAAFMVLKLSGGEEPAPRLANRAQPVQVSPQAAPKVETANVYVASSFIPIGTVIEESMLTVQPWPKHLLIDGFVVGSEEGKKIIGTVTRASFQELEPIIKTKVVNPQDPNFLAGDLPKGKRVITMDTNEIRGVAGFIFPGDHVDVIIRHKILREGITQRDIDEAKQDDDTHEVVTETLMDNVKVLAVDQRAVAGVDPKGGIIIPKSVSLEVEPADAQRIVLARETGELTLALRSIKDKETTEKVAITREPDLSQFDMSSIATKKDTDDKPIKIVRGTEVETVDPKAKAPGGFR